MFCTNCGYERRADVKFCTSCGDAVSTAAKTESRNQKSLSLSDETPNVARSISDQINKNGLSRIDLEKKPWYRALKLLFISVIVIAALFIGIISFSVKPEKSIDGHNSLIVCNNGKSYAPDANRIYIYGAADVLSSYDDKNARILCQYDSLNFSQHYSEFILKNYTFSPVFEESQESEWIGYTLLAYFVLWIIILIIRAGFFYITTGNKAGVSLKN